MFPLESASKKKRKPKFKPRPHYLGKKKIKKKTKKKKKSPAYISVHEHASHTLNITCHAPYIQLEYLVDFA